MPILLLLAFLAAISLAQPQPPFTDQRDGKKYKAVKIGEQVWMSENLNYNAENSHCYEDEPANCDKYGRLYDWETAMKACPKGWHLPDTTEWNAIENLIDTSFASLYGGSALFVGAFCCVDKAGYWWSITEYDVDVNYYPEYNAYVAYFRYIDNYGNRNRLQYGSKKNLRSVRCVRD